MNILKKIGQVIVAIVASIIFTLYMLWMALLDWLGRITNRLFGKR